MKKEQNNSFVKERITHTLLNLMKKYSFEEITITEIVKHASVGRASFYRNFISKEDVLKQYLLKLIQGWIAEFEQSQNLNLVESSFGHYLKYSETYQLLYKCGLSYFSKAAAALSLLVSIGAVVTMVVVNRRQSKKAYDDPALMVKRYKSVLNPHMEATLMLGIGSVRHVDIPKRG